MKNTSSIINPEDGEFSTIPRKVSNFGDISRFVNTTIQKFFTKFGLRADDDAGVEKLTGTIFRDILKMDDSKIAKVGELLSQTVDAIKFEDEMPNDRLKSVVEEAHKVIKRWNETIKDKDFMIKINGNNVIRAICRLNEIKGALASDISYYETLTEAFAINRRATRSAIAVAVRQFSSDMDTNIRKLLTVEDSKNFGEIMSTHLHKGELTSLYVSKYLGRLEFDIKSTIEIMQMVVNQLKFDMRLAGIGKV